jgi:hypothetical protein
MRTRTNYIFILLCMILFSCEKDPIAPVGKGNINTLSTNDVFQVSVTTALAGLTVRDEGGEALGASGLHYGLGIAVPSVDDFTAIGSTALGSTNITLRDLVPGRNYFVRSFATTRSGKTYYGNVKSFTTANHPANFTNEMVAYYALNNGGIDYSNSNNSLSFLNFIQAVPSRNGSSKSALYFNGSNSTIYKSSLNRFPRGRSPFSLTFWFKPTVTNTGTILGYGTGGGENSGSVYFKLNPGGCTIYHWNNDRSFSYTFNPNNWYFATITYDGFTELLYIRELGSNFYSNWQFPTTSININPLYLSIGSRVTNAGGNATEFFNGSVDDVRVFNRAISFSELNYWYSN